MDKLDISVIITNRNGMAVLPNCLRTLLAEPVNEIIIVDNGSDDGSVSYVKSISDQRLSIIQNNNNNGYAEANNQGYHRSTAKFIVFLNNDTICLPGFLEPLVVYLKEQRQVAAVQPLILFPDMTIDSVGSYLTPTGFLYHRAHRQKLNVQNSQPALVYSLKGACMVWRRAVLEQIGVFDETYFAYFEETELCNRALRAGYQLATVPRSAIIHLGGFTSNSMDQSFIQFYNTKNRLQTYLRHLPLALAWHIILINILLSELLVLHSFFHSAKLAIAIQKGIFAGIANGLIYRRKHYVQSYDLSQYLKKPDFSYYRALFSSLQHYDKLW